jgi:hypothetical protein
MISKCLRMPWLASVLALAACGQITAPAAPSAPSSSSLAAAVAPLLQRGQVEVTTIRRPDGALLKRARLGQGFDHVLIQRVGREGHSEIACVDTVDQAEQFLKAEGRGGSR